MEDNMKYAVLITLLFFPSLAFAKCHVGDNIYPNDDSIWIVSCHSTDNGDWMLDSAGKVHSDDTKAIKKAMKATNNKTHKDVCNKTFIFCLDKNGKPLD